MFFTRTYKYHTSITAEDIKGRLLGKHVTVHNLDFEVAEDGNTLSITPHAEAVQAIKTLPETKLRLTDKGNKTQVIINSRMRKIDEGGPLLIVIFCIFMFVGSMIALIVGKDDLVSIFYTMMSISLLIFTIFWIRLESGYFDYVRKIRDYIKKTTK